MKKIIHTIKKFLISNKNNLPLVTIVIVLIAGLFLIIKSGLKFKLPSTIWNDPPKVDTTLTQATGEYKYQNLTNNFKSYFKDNPTVGGAVKFTNSMSSLSFSTPAKQTFGQASKNPSPVMSNNSVIYNNVFKQIDIKYTVGPQRLLEEFIVKDKGTALTINKISQSVQTTGVDSYIEGNGGIVFYKGKVASMIIPKPVIYEEGNDKISSYGIEYEISKTSKDTYLISKVITEEGKKWLSDPARKYPIVIDLVIDNADTASSWVSSDPGNTNVSSETTIKEEGTGSVKVQTSAGTNTTVDLMEYSSNALAQAAYPSYDGFYALGGTIATASGYTVHTFTSTGAFRPSANRNVDILVVAGAGGGGGSNGAGGGGGAGGIQYFSNQSVANQSYTVTVGTGGAGSAPTAGTAANGTVSTFGSLQSSVGGGGGGGYNGTLTTAPNSGGSGGGGGSSGSGSFTGAGGTAGQGYAGGNGRAAGGVADQAGGGGGGASEVGTASTDTYGGDGGDGTSYSITGASVTYGGGGGGGKRSTEVAGAGGAGGGGNAVVGGSGGAGTDGLGGGGAAGGNGGTGGKGGNGIIIVRYFTPPSLQSYSEATIKTEGSYSLKGIASITDPINNTLTRTISPTLNLSTANSIGFDIRSTRTGSNIKIGFHDTGGVTTEITPNIISANVFQTAVLDISGVSTGNKDTIDKIIITIVNADAVNTFYLDNMIAYANSLNNTVTLTKASTNLSSYNYLSFWVRSNTTGVNSRFQFGETDSSEQTYNITINQANTWELKSWDISGISTNARDAVTKFAFKITVASPAQTFYFDNILAGMPPNSPTLSANYLHDKVKIASTTPQIRFNSTDPEGDSITYQVQYDTDGTFASPTTKTSDTDSGFANVTTPSDTDPFNSGNTVSFTFPTLSNVTTYFYRVRGKDPLGQNAYGGWSAVRSFTIDTSTIYGTWYETLYNQFITDTPSSSYVTISPTNNNVYLDSTYSKTIDMMEYSTDANAQAAYPSDDNFYALGGTIATASGYTVHTFTSTGAFRPSYNRKVDILVVAGAGGGAGTVHYPAAGAGGGGGAGGVQYFSNQSVVNQSYTVTVGTGGAGNGADGGTASNGTDSTFGSLQSSVGGGGGGGQLSDNTCTVGGTGGSGGGGNGSCYPPDTLAGGEGTAGQGYAGGTGYRGGNASNREGGGGGGASEVGTDATSTHGGDGGDGIYSTISGTGTYYGGGGGGGQSTTSTPASVGGAGGGGAGGRAAAAGGGDGTAGTDGLGGGGGGGGYEGLGADGGNGIIIVRYLTPPSLISYSEATIKTEGSYSLKGIAPITDSLNNTLTRTLSPTLDLTGATSLYFDIRSTRTGSNIKIEINDTGGTTTEIIPNVTSANTYQTVNWDVSAVANEDKDTINKIIITIVNANADNTFYIDNFYAHLGAPIGTIMSTSITAANIHSGDVWGPITVGKTETNGSITVQVYYDVTGTPTIVPDSALAGNSTGFSGTSIDLGGLSTSTYPILYLKATLTYSGGSPTLNDWQILISSKPTTPVIDPKYLADKIKTADTTPTIRFVATDADNDNLTYQVEYDTDGTFPSPTTKTSDTDSGFANLTTPSDTDPFNSGDTIAFTFPTLSNGTTYFYRVRVKDPAGINIYSSWTNFRSLTIDTSLISGNTWFETHHDQFYSDTTTGSVSVNVAGNYVEVLPLNFDTWIYQTPVTLTNGGGTQTNYDVLISLDTATLISGGKMLSTCNDLRITDSDSATLLEYWIEGGCNTATTQIWARVPTIPNGTKTIYIYYGKAGAANAEVSWTGKFITLSNAACSGTWTRNADFDLNFPKGSSTSYAGTGGLTAPNYSHTHTVTATTNVQNRSYCATSQGSTQGATENNHSHGVTASSTVSTNNLPPYIDMIFCENNSLELTTSSVGLFDVSSQTGWTQYTALNGKFPRGNSTAGGTGGYSTHNHTFSFTTAGGGSGSMGSCTSNCYENPVNNHTHSVANKAVTGTNIPAYLDVVYFQKNSAGNLTTEHPILMLNTTSIPLGWTRFSALDDRFPEGNTTYGASSSTSLHSHSGTQGTGSANNTISAWAGNDALGDQDHGHTVTYSTNSVDIAPPYHNVIYAQRNSPTVSTGVGTEGVNSGMAGGTLTSTPITAANINVGNIWGTATIDKTETHGSIKIQVYYGGTPTLIPDSVLAGNSTGFSGTSINLEGLSTVTYPTLYLVATFDYSGGSPTLNSWELSTSSIPSLPTGLLVNDITTPAGITTPSPYFSAFCNGEVGVAFNKYQIQVSTTDNFSTTVWDSGSSGTAMSDCIAIARSANLTYGGTPFTMDGTTYYWRIRLWNQFEKISPWSNEFTLFSVNTAQQDSATQCVIEEAHDDTYLNINWNDNSGSETGYTLEKNINGAGFSAFQTLGANTITYHDTDISQGNTYQYQVRSIGTSSTDWCITSMVTLNAGTFEIKGLNLKGVNLR